MAQPRIRNNRLCFLEPFQNCFRYRTDNLALHRRGHVVVCCVDNFDLVSFVEINVVQLVGVIFFYDNFRSNEENIRIISTRLIRGVF